MPLKRHFVYLDFVVLTICKVADNHAVCISIDDFITSFCQRLFWVPTTPAGVSACSRQALIRWASAEIDVIIVFGDVRVPLVHAVNKAAVFDFLAVYVPFAGALPASQVWEVPPVRDNSRCNPYGLQRLIHSADFFRFTPSTKAGGYPVRLCYLFPRRSHIQAPFFKPQAERGQRPARRD